MTTDFLEYLREESQEIERLERKTDPEAVLRQARWARRSACGFVLYSGGGGVRCRVFADFSEPPSLHLYAVDCLLRDEGSPG